MAQRRRTTGWHGWWQLALPALAGTMAVVALLWHQYGSSWSPPRAVAQDLGDAAPAGMAPDVSEIPAAQGNRPGARPFGEPPRLLSEAEVTQGLAARHRALRQRFLAHQDRRRQEPPEDYAIPEPPANAPVPPRPDAPGGEFDAEGVR